MKEETEELEWSRDELRKKNEQLMKMRRELCRWKAKYYRAVEFVDDEQLRKLEKADEQAHQRRKEMNR